MLQLLRVSGDSLLPDYQDGDFVLAIRIPTFFRFMRPGSRIVFRRDGMGMLIKTVAAITPGGGQVTVTGSHPDSIDSRQFGPIRREDVLGLVVWHISRPAPESRRRSGR